MNNQPRIAPKPFVFKLVLVWQITHGPLAGSNRNANLRRSRTDTPDAHPIICNALVGPACKPPLTCLAATKDAAHIVEDAHYPPISPTPVRVHFSSPAPLTSTNNLCTDFANLASPQRTSAAHTNSARTSAARDQLLPLKSLASSPEPSYAISKIRKR